MNAIEPEGLVSPSDIAEMAGVTRGAVSNWRRRIKGFPKPIAGTEAKPLFSRREARNWLAHRGVEATRDMGEAAVWSVMNALRGQLEARDAVELILSLCAVHKLLSGPERSRWDKLIKLAETDTRAALAQIDQLLRSRGIVIESSLESDRRLTAILPVRLHQVMSAIGAVEPGYLASTADFALDRLEKSQMRSAGEYGVVSSRISKLLASLASKSDGGILYDPACGLAGALIAAVVEEGAQPNRIVGHDISPSAIKLASLRAFLASVHLELAVINVLMQDIDPDLKADVVVAEPPFGMRVGDHVALDDARFSFGPIPRNSSELLWIQHVVHHLRDNGRGYVVTPQGPLFRGGPEAKIRGELLLRNCIEAIVALPGKMLPYTAIPLALWSLRSARSEGAGDTVLLIDAAKVAAPEEFVADWLRTEHVPDDVPHVRASVTDLLAANADLFPSRWTESRVPSGAKLRDARRDAERALRDALSKLDHASRDLDLSIDLPSARISTVQELVDLSVISVKPGKKFAGDDPVIGDRVVTVTQVNHGTLPPGQGTVPSDVEAWITRANDLLVTTMNRVQSLVDHDGGHLPLPGIYRVRIQKPDVLLPEYLARVLEGDWNKRFVGGAAIQRANLKELEVPLIPLSDQARVVEAIQEVQAIRETARAVEGSSAVAIGALLAAVRHQRSEEIDALPRLHPS